MANRVSLLDLRREPTPDASGSVSLNPDPVEFVAEGSDCLPLFWATLFNLTDMVQAADGEGGALYPVLVAPTGVAVERSRERCRVAASLLPAAAARHVDEWNAALSGLRGGFVAVETLELWAMGPDDFFDELVDLLGWVASPQTGTMRTIRMLTGIECNARGQIRIDDRLATSLRGYGWEGNPAWVG